MNVKDELGKIVNHVHRSLFTMTSGRIGGQVMGMEALVLTTTGRRSGEPRRNMLTTPIVETNRLVLVASWGGDDRHPQWFLNVRANPDVEITRAGETRAYRAREATAAERAELWPRVVDTYKGYGGYQTKTEREIPLVICERV
ncbi:MAG TPA: nitroreductase/quinone reductase family protein [Acidimicrobiales bacterium]|nr:nitroreductase/quinone reductase family protein [Acidimicrobiales bacterium]